MVMGLSELQGSWGSGWVVADLAAESQEGLLAAKGLCEVALLLGEQPHLVLAGTLRGVRGTFCRTSLARLQYQAALFSLKRLGHRRLLVVHQALLCWSGAAYGMSAAGNPSIGVGGSGPG